MDAAVVKPSSEWTACDGACENIVGASGSDPETLGFGMPARRFLAGTTDPTLRDPEPGALTSPARRVTPCTLNRDKIKMVGASGFEPPTSWSRTRRSNQAEPRPDVCGNNFRIAQLAHRLENGEFTRATVTLVAAEQVATAASKFRLRSASRFAIPLSESVSWQYDQPSSSRR